MAEAAGGKAAAGAGASGGFQSFVGAARAPDVAMALGVMAIILMLILPMPSWLLDFALATSITFSVMVLMTSLFIEKPLQLSSFPTVLLIATMLRLSLNLASTRLILAKGHEGPDAAGHVIEAFGQFLMGGTVIIGVIVFAILVIVNFVVITKGSGRIAEVAARFSLDAMPGKQMAIDADLSAGLITEAEAKARRKELEDESAFFGAMDGAAKFVRGDAIAGLLITFINIIGGMFIGMIANGMSFADAIDRYTVLTVGDGLVSQIPALIVSVAAGMLVTKAKSEGTTDKALAAQFSAFPKALGVTAGLLFLLGFMPGLPVLPFVTLGGVLAYATFAVDRRNRKATAARETEKKSADKAASAAEEPITNALAIDMIRLELGYGLLQLINDDSGYRLTDQIKALRRQLASEMGFIMPSVRILDNMQLPTNAYAIRIKEVETARGEVKPGFLLVMDPRGEPVNLPGEKTTEPAFGLPATWVDRSMREEASFRGLTVVDAATVVTTHLTEVIRDNMPDLLSYAETQKLLDELPKEHQKLVSDLIPNLVSVSTIQRVLQSLLAERVSIRDLPTILEGIAETAGANRSILEITEHVRGRLARQLSSAHAGQGGQIPLLTLSPRWEQIFAESIVGQGEERQLAMAPSALQEFMAALKAAFDRAASRGESPVLLTSPGIRPFVRSIIERIRPATTVLSQSEIHPKAKLRTLGQV
ncbi:MAG: flagellar biosynthesis protein FlhA [Rhodothalassiaceae bacterium]